MWVFLTSIVLYISTILIYYYNIYKITNDKKMVVTNLNIPKLNKITEIIQISDIHIRNGDYKISRFDEFTSSSKSGFGNSCKFSFFPMIICLKN